MSHLAEGRDSERSYQGCGVYSTADDVMAVAVHGAGEATQGCIGRAYPVPGRLQSRG